MTSESSTSVDDIMETASQWFARMDSGEGDQAAFEAWRTADPRHAAAFARIYASMRQMERLRGLADPEPVRVQVSAPSATRRRLLQLGGAAAGVTVASLAGMALFILTSGRVEAATRVGERKTVVFPNGGEIELNTDSRAAWKIKGDERTLWLKRGEVAVKVPVSGRGLELKAGPHAASLGPGEYIARLRDNSLDIISLAGTATVSQDGAPPLRVNAHQAAILIKGQERVRPVSTNDLDFLTGWRTDELVLNGQVLSEVVEEYNRYLDRKIIIANPEIGAIQLGGRFTNRDPARLLAGLEVSFGIHVTQQDNTIILSR